MQRIFSATLRCFLTVVVVVSVPFASEVLAQGKKKPNTNFPADSESFSKTLDNGKKVVCVDHDENGTYVPAIQKGANLQNPTARLKAIKTQLKKAVAKQKAKLIKEQKNIKAYVKLAKSTCAAGPDQPGLDPTPTPPGGSPTATPGADPTATPPVSQAECESMEAYTGTFGTAEKTHLLTKFGYGGAGVKEQRIMAAANISDFATAATTLVTEDQGFDAAVDGLAASDFVNMSNDAILLAQINTSNPVFFRAAEAIHDINTTGSNVLAAGEERTWYDHWKDVILAGAKSNSSLFDIVKASAEHPMMLRYLDGDKNTKFAPNENYGRELKELFTLGVVCPGGDRNYTETRPDGDVLNTSKALTGYLVSMSNGRLQASFVDALHDSTPQTMFRGTSYECVASNLDEIVTCIKGHPCAGKYWAQEILESFITENPPQGLIDNFTATLRANNYQVMSSLKTLMMSKAAMCSSYTDSVTPKPDAFIARMARIMNLRDAINADIQQNIGTLANGVESAGFRFDLPETVFYYERSDFRNPTTALENLNNVGNLVAIARSAGSALFNPDTILPSAPNATSTEVVDHIAQALGVFPLNENVKAAFANYLDNRIVNGVPVRDVYVNTDQNQLDYALTLYAIMAMLPQVVLN